MLKIFCRLRRQEEAKQGGNPKGEGEILGIPLIIAKMMLELIISEIIIIAVLNARLVLIYGSNNFIEYLFMDEKAPNYLG